MMYLFGLIWKPSRSLKMYVWDHEYVVNLDPSVKTLIFGARIDIHDAVRYI